MHNYIKLSLTSLLALTLLSACVGTGDNTNGSQASGTMAKSQKPIAKIIPRNQETNSLPGDTIIPNSNIKMEITKISKAVFAGLSYANTTFTITNISNQTIGDVTSFNVAVDAPGTWTNVSTANCTSIQPGKTCTISGTFSIPSINQNALIHVSLNQNGTPIYEYNQNVVAIKQTDPNFIAMRMIHPVNETNQTVYAVVTMLDDNRVNNVMVKFDKDSDGYYKGSKTTDKNDNWDRSYKYYAVQIAGPGTTENNSVLYLPKGGSGVIYLSFNNPLSDGPAPDINGGDANNINTRFQTIEFSNDGDRTFANLTNVDHVSIPMEMDWVDINNSAVLRVTAAYDMLNKPMTEVLDEMAAGLEGYGSWGKLVQRDSSNHIIRIMSPAKKMGLPPERNDFYTPEMKEAFSNYIDDIWNYYKGTDAQGNPHYLYVDTTEVVNPYKPGVSCLVRGRVVLRDGQEIFHFEPLPGYEENCPATDSDNIVPGKNNPDFTKFTAEDFLKGASGADQTTFGISATYRSVIGRSIVSAQSIGFLPFCANPNLYITSNKDKYLPLDNYLFSEPYFPLYYTQQYGGCLSQAATYKDLVINQYSAHAALYFNYYNYAYSDAINKDGTLVGNNLSSPLTITIGKMQ